MLSHCGPGIFFRYISNRTWLKGGRKRVWSAVGGVQCSDPLLHLCNAVYSHNLPMCFPNGHFLSILFTEMDESQKTFPENQLPQGHFPNQFFTIFSFFHNFFSFFTIFFRFSQFFFSFTIFFIFYYFFCFFIFFFVFLWFSPRYFMIFFCFLHGLGFFSLIIFSISHNFFS